MPFDKPGNKTTGRLRKLIGGAGTNVRGTTKKSTVTRPQRPQLFNSKKRK